MISDTQAKILSLLVTRAAQGAYGSELVHLSGGTLKRGTVYTLLGRLEDAGLVTLEEEEPTETLALPRTRYRITGAGYRALEEFARWLALPQQLVWQGAS